jgi:DNA-directed RNA polymerase subunit RPC12/RpoP
MKIKHNNRDKDSTSMSYQCPTCGKKYEYQYTLARQVKTEHKDVLHVDPTVVKPSHAWVKDATDLISYTCLKCGQKFPSQQFLDIHIKEKGNKQEYPLEWDEQDELDVHVDQEHVRPILADTLVCYPSL